VTQVGDIVLTVRQAAAMAGMDSGDLANLIGTPQGPPTLKARDVAEWLDRMEESEN
jgi:hypothetical protein